MARPPRKYLADAFRRYVQALGVEGSPWSPFRFVQTGTPDRFTDTAQLLAKALAPMFDDVRKPAPVRTLEDMSEDEIEAIERRYNAKVKR